MRMMVQIKEMKNYYQDCDDYEVVNGVLCLWRHPSNDQAGRSVLLAAIPLANVLFFCEVPKALKEES